MKKRISVGFTLMRGDKPAGQAESRFSRTSRLVTPCYNTLTKAKTKATRMGLSYDDIYEAFVEVDK